MSFKFPDNVNEKKTRLKELSSQSRLCRHRSASTDGLVDIKQSMKKVPPKKHTTPVEEKLQSPNTVRKHQPLKRTTASSKSRLNKSFDAALTGTPPGGDQTQSTPTSRGSCKKKDASSGEKRSFVNLMRSKFTKSSSSISKNSQKKPSNDK